MRVTKQHARVSITRATVTNSMGSCSKPTVTPTMQHRTCIHDERPIDRLDINPLVVSLSDLEPAGSVLGNKGECTKVGVRRRSKHIDRSVHINRWIMQ